MKINTKVFGEVEIEDDKIISFPGGIIGFPELTDFALLHDEEKGVGAIHWLQSIQEPGFAMPVMDPLAVVPEYNPQVDEAYRGGDSGAGHRHGSWRPYEDDRQP